MSRESYRFQFRWIAAALAAAATAAALGIAGCQRPAPTVRMAAGPARGVPRPPAELQAALARNLEAALAAVDRYESLCKQAESLAEGLGRRGLTPDEAGRLARIAAEADEALDDLDARVGEQTRIIEEALAARVPAGGSAAAQKREHRP